MKILKINSSSNTQNSVTRQHVDAIIDKLGASNDVDLTNRDVAYDKLPYLDDSYLAASFAQGEQTPEQIEALKLSDTLVDELLATDVLVIGAPMYNFTVSASLKAYIDLIARAGRTFKYGENGPVGLVEGKKAYVVISTGGTPIGSPYDFIKGYLQTFLGFVGITDVEFIVFDEMMSKAEEKTSAGQAVIELI